MGYFIDAAKEAVYLGTLTLVWGVYLFVLFWAVLRVGMLVPGPGIVALIVMIAGVVGGIYLGLRALGNPITKLLTSVRRDIEHFQ